MVKRYNGVDLTILGKECKKFRKANGWKQADIARDLNISRELVSGFECGRSNNLLIFSWYLDRGFDYGENVSR